LVRDAALRVRACHVISSRFSGARGILRAYRIGLLLINGFVSPDRRGAGERLPN